MSKIVKFLRDPALFFQDAANNRRVSSRAGIPTYVVGFSTWKTYMRKFFPDRNLTFLPREISEHEFKLVWQQKILADKKSEIFIWGFKAPAYILNFIEKNNVKVVFVEDGFVRSVQLGASKAPPMSLCLDTRTPYFNTRVASDLEVLLQEYDFAANPNLLERADSAIQLMLQSGISKYNNAPQVDIARIYGPKKKHRVLVIGQVEDDASIEFGCDKPITNNELVRLAAQENPGAQIIYKPHPDVLEGHRAKQSDPAEVSHICDLLTQSVPLAQAFETIDHVYTITSLAGFEALLRGIKVTTLGAPFYAGWGVTDDRQATPRRTNKLTVQQLFAGAYLLYPKYFDPESGKEQTLEEVIVKIQNDRKFSLIQATPSKGKSALVGVPKMDVRPDVIATYLIGEVSYKPLLASWFTNRRFIVIPATTSAEEFTSKFKKGLDNQYAEVFLADGPVAPFLRRYLDANRDKITYLGDGFLRSVAFGSKTPPYSLLLDRRTPYYDARQSSDLEELIGNYDFDGDTVLMERAIHLLAELVESGLSKYNHVPRVPDLENVYGPKEKTRVLVLGQLENAASVKLANPRGYTNSDVVTIAAMENPDAQIIYKPHPGVIGQLGKAATDSQKFAHLCQVLEVDIPLAQALETIDHVYSISSLGGFEALLRRIKTTTLGLPFYAGWGLGDDRHPIERRTRTLDIEQVFAAAYVLYPVYVDPLYKMQVQLEETISRLDREQSIEHAVLAIDTSVSDLGGGATSHETAARVEQTPKPIITTYLIGDLSYKQLLPGWFADRKLIVVPKTLTNDEFVAKFKKGMDHQNAEFFLLDENVAPFLKKYLDANRSKRKFFTEGFLRSVALGNAAPPYSILLDSRAPYFDARQASDLEELLNTYDFDGDSALMSSAYEFQRMLIEKGLSKFNHAYPVADLEKVYGVKKGLRVLVLGQVESAPSVKFANPRNYTNNDVVMIAAMENPDAQIIFKPHPEVINKMSKAGSDASKVAHLCQILDVDLPLAQALDTIDHVYSISSLGGFESLLRGIKTTTLGLPFYAGWGLGDDRQVIDRRRRSLTVAQVFAGAYQLYPIYVDPLYKAQIQSGEVVRRLDAGRTTFHQSQSSAGGLAKGGAKDLWASFVKFGDWDDESKPIAFAFSFTAWRFAQIAAYFPEYRFAFHAIPPGEREKVSLRPVYALFNSVENKVFIVLGKKEPPGLLAYVDAAPVEVIRVEDGFIRGVGLGAELSPPLSLALDRTGMYFDARSPSDMENILNTFDFDADPKLMADARTCIERIVRSRATKYNLDGAFDAERMYGPKTKRRVLVIGQVENDASIMYGCDRTIDNNGLVMLAALENPDAEIIYKPHPDVIRGNRRFFSNPKDVENVAKVIYDAVGIHQALDTIDHVYSITSLAGFEALLRGIPVTTFGAPFYSGWGLTDARQPTPRRTRELSVEQVFAGAYMLYMKYRHPITSQPCDLPTALDMLDWMRENKTVLAPKFKTDIEIAKQHFKIYQPRLKEGLLDSAVDEITSAIKLDPDNHTYPLARARLLLEKGDLSAKTKSDLRDSVKLAGKGAELPLRALASHIWKVEGITPELLEVASTILSNNPKLDVKVKMWIAAVYADAGYIENAADLYFEAMEQDSVVASRQRYLPLLYRVGSIYPRRVENFDRVKTAYEALAASAGKFEAIIKSKRSVAIVGNSPCELGKSLGAKIDAHDVVIRFNNFSTLFPFSRDYGEKTNIWVKTGFFETVKRRDVRKFDLVVQSASQLATTSSKGVDLVWSILSEGAVMELVPSALRFSLIQRLNAPPSAGLLILCWIYSISGPLNKNSVFGFSFTDQMAGGHTSYHSVQDGGSYKHNWTAERKIFDELFEV